MFLMKNLNRMSIKEEWNISTYFMAIMDIKNQLKAFGEVIANKTLINIVLNGLPWSYKIVIQDISYMD